MRQFCPIRVRQLPSRPVVTLVVAGASIALSMAGLPTASAALPTQPATNSPLRSHISTATITGGPHDPVISTLPVPRAGGQPATARGGAAVVAALRETTTTDYGMVAVTWDHNSAADGTRVFIRSRVAGSWSGWNQVAVEPDEGPAPSEDSTVRDGTSPMWVGSADGVAVRVTAPDGSTPTGLKVDTIQPDRAATGARVPTSRGYVATTGEPIPGPVDFPAMPKIVTRKQWGADPRLGDQCWDPVYGDSAQMVFIHHTVNSNDYAPSDGAAIMQSILAYHTQSRGWCDIGYNFLVDRYGTIYEGRRGGMRLPVRGSHAGDYNVDTVGISLIGNFDIARPTRPMKNALVRLVGWRLGTSYMPVQGQTTVNGKRFNRISGHRDAMSTTCPGRYAYAFLPTLRTRVADYLSLYQSTIPPKAAVLGSAVTGTVFSGESAARGGRHTEYTNGVMFAKPGDGTHWLSGRSLESYRAYHGLFGRLGYPRTDTRTTDVARVRVIRFEHGVTFRIGKLAARTLWGRIMLRYRKLDGIHGGLGLPMTSVEPTDVGESATFEHGSIQWDQATNTISVQTW